MAVARDENRRRREKLHERKKRAILPSSASLDGLKAVPICIQPDEAVWKGCIQTGEVVTKNPVEAVRRSKGKCNKRLKRIVLFESMP